MRARRAWIAQMLLLLTVVLVARAGRAQQGPYSEVTLDTLLDTPIRGHDALVDASGAAILAYGDNMSVGEVDGFESAVTEQDFWLEVTADLPAGVTSLLVEVNAPTRGSDSFHCALDGEQLDYIVLPYLHFGTVSITAELASAGTHTFRLWHREGPGAAIRRIALGGHVWSALPAMQPALAAAHPRMYLTSDELPTLRERLDDPRVQEFYRLPSVLADSPPADSPGSYRYLARYALGHLLAPDAAQLAAVVDWLTMATSYGDVGADLEAEYFLEGVALSYDWLYDEIPTSLRDQVRDLIVDKCRIIFAASLDGRAGGGLAYQQNHYWYASFALALGAAAVYGEVPEAEAWLWWAWDRLERMLLTFSPDGSFHEGPAYWDFSMPTFYLYTDLYEQLTGLPIMVGDDGLGGQGQFRFHYLLPGFEATAAMEDTQTSHGSLPVRLLLWEAKRFQDPLTMGLAELLSTGSSNLHFHLLWLDEQLAASAPLDEVPLGRHYADVETAFGRSAWDADATYVAMVSRPLGGHKWADLCDDYGLGGTGHNHPAQNHFVLFGRGEMLAGDPGYTYEKKTRNHNTVLVDGQGQYGDGEMWPGPTQGRSFVSDFVNEGDITIAGGDATSAYPEELGLERFHRWLVLAGADLVVVRDRLEASAPRTFGWLLHHWGELTDEGDRLTIVRGAAGLTLFPLRPADATVATETYRPEYIHPERDLTPEEPDVSLIELESQPTTDETFLVPLVVGDAAATAPQVSELSQVDFDAVQVLDTLVAFNRTDGTMTLPLPWGGSLTTDAQVVVARLHDGEQQIVTAPMDGTGGSGTGGSGSGAAGAGGGSPGAALLTPGGEDDSGCGCRMVGSAGSNGGHGGLVGLLFSALIVRRRMPPVARSRRRLVSPCRAVSKPLLCARADAAAAHCCGRVARVAFV